MTKPCPPDLAAFKHEPADYEAVTPWTPGPWHLFMQNRVIEIWDHPNSDEAKAVVHWAGFDSAEVGKRETEANARLIAAAPALYAALGAMVEGFGGFNTCEGPKPDCTQKALAALALARGETSHD